MRGLGGGETWSPPFLFHPVPHTHHPARSPVLPGRDTWGLAVTWGAAAQRTVELISAGLGVPSPPHRGPAPPEEGVSGCPAEPRGLGSPGQDPCCLHGASARRSRWQQGEQPVAFICER